MYLKEGLSLKVVVCRKKETLEYFVQIYKAVENFMKPFTSSKYLQQLNNGLGVLFSAMADYFLVMHEMYSNGT